MIIGTNHFPDIKRAVDYYRSYSDTPFLAVKRKYESGEIVIGKPDLKKGEKLILIDKNTRYAIKS
jgi:hypothetical protein